MVHSGFFEAAKWFMENICHQLIIFAMEYDLENIYICGHSLGGSASALTTILFVDSLRKEEGLWPNTSKGAPINIHCYAFGMAPVITRELCEDYMQFIDVFVYGDDCVPRLSYGSFIDFQILMVYAAQIGKTNHVFKDSLSETVYEKMAQARNAMRSQIPQMNLKLYVPGHIHHLMKLKAPGGKKYTIIDSCAPDRFVEAHVTRKMFSHHMPSKYEKALEDAYLLLVEEELERLSNPDLSPDHLQTTIEDILSVSEFEDDADDSLDSRTPSPAVH